MNRLKGILSEIYLYLLVFFVYAYTWYFNIFVLHQSYLDVQNILLLPIIGLTSGFIINAVIKFYRG